MHYNFSIQITDSCYGIPDAVAAVHCTAASNGGNKEEALSYLMRGLDLFTKGRSIYWRVDPVAEEQYDFSTRKPEAGSQGDMQI